MKSNNIIYKITLFLLMVVAVGILYSCEDDDLNLDRTSEFGEADYAALQAKISEVEAYLSTAEEGVNAGNHPPGSIEDFTPIVESSKKVISKGMNQSITDRAVERLTEEFEEFRNNVVGPANPWIQQVQGNYIAIQDHLEGDGTEGGVKGLLDRPFTIEAKFWIVNLQQSGFSNVMFSSAMGGGGANDRGFVVRYFASGNMQFIVGGTDEGWKEAAAPDGTMKAGQWMHVSFVNTMDRQSLYVNGVEVASQDATYLDSDDEFPFTIGNAFPWQERAMNGMVKDFRFWTRALSEADIMNNMEADLTGSETDLEILLPFDANLGREFADISNKYYAVFQDNVVWVEDGDLGSVELDLTTIQAAIASAEDIIDNGVEGNANGNYPVGTKAFLQNLVDEANDLIANTSSQADIDGLTNEMEEKISLVEANLVADAEGIKVDAQEPGAVGIRVTPTFSPPASFTIEFEMNVESLQSSCCEQGNAVGNGSYGLIYGAYDHPDNSEQVLNAGGLYFFIRNGGGYDGPRSDPRVIEPGTWQHYGMVYDAPTQTAYIYVDGVEVASFVGRDVPDPVDWSEMWIGNTWVISDASYRNFRFWTEAKDALQLNADINGSEANLEMYFPMDRVAGVFFKDATGDYDAEIRGVQWNAQ